jgi:hypothetical protein
MLSPEDARTIVQVGAGSAVGEMLRRYWMPVAASAELDERPIRPVRVPAPALRSVVRHGRGRGHPLQPSRLAL